MSTAPPLDDTTATLRDQLRITIDTLERVVADRGLLALLSEDERIHLRRVAAEFYTPDIAARRRMIKAIGRQRRAKRAERDEQVLQTAAIRTEHRRPVATTPNVFPPEAFAPDDLPPAEDDTRDAAAADASAAVSVSVSDSASVPASASPSAQGTARETLEPQYCYICKQPYSSIHHFYDRLCPGCADLNFRKRTELADLRGRTALLTGGRVKIGYHIGLKLLRSGAHLVVTTRFPRNAAARFAGEPDFGEWADRLEIFGLDLRHTPSVEAFCHQLTATHDRLDFIVNNACQTVRRPPAFYTHMMAAENAALRDVPAHVQKVLGAAVRGGSRDAAVAIPDGGHPIADAARLSQVPLLPEDVFESSALFPAGQLDADFQQIDLRGRNSWRLLLSEVSAVEFLEVQLVNAVAPFIFNARLKPLMLRTPNHDKHIVNVSAVEGQFYRRWKTTRHPHTNMAKAALNMMTRTAATDYQADGIHMNSVDTGWVTDEDPVEIAQRKTREQGFHPPLDIVDGAARVVDPIMTGINTGTHVWGQFLKDYKATDW